MTSLRTPRDPVADHLLTPQNAGVVIIDFQPVQVASIASMNKRLLVANVVDAVGGTSAEAHRAGLERIVQAGGVPISWIQLACELQRDWNRESTAAGFAEIVFAEVGH